MSTDPLYDYPVVELYDETSAIRIDPHSDYRLVLPPYQRPPEFIRHSGKVWSLIGTEVVIDASSDSYFGKHTRMKLAYAELRELAEGEPFLPLVEHVDLRGSHLHSVNFTYNITQTQTYRVWLSASMRRQHQLGQMPR